MKFKVGQNVFALESAFSYDPVPAVVTGYKPDVITIRVNDHYNDRWYGEAMIAERIFATKADAYVQIREEARRTVNRCEKDLADAKAYLEKAVEKLTNARCEP